MPIYSQYDVPNSAELVNLGVGQPSTEDLPLDWLKTTLLNIGNNLNSPEVLQYGAIPGYDNIRNSMASWLTKKYYQNITKKIDVKHIIDKDQIFMTNGNTGALQLLLHTFIESGDEVIIEDPTYMIAKDIFEEYGCNINTIPMEDDGLDVFMLEEKIKTILADDPKELQNRIFLYTIPFHHNPTSITLSHKKKKKIAELCFKYPKFYVISDEVYHFLSFNEKENEKLYPFADYHPKILSLGSFSKLIAPALRVGWIYQNTDSILLEDKFNIIGKLKKSSLLNSSGGINPFGFLLIENAIISGQIDDIINKNILMLNSKCNLMIDFLQKNNFSELVKKPKGGYFLWVKTKFEDAKKFLDFALKFKVKFHPGSSFGDNCDNYIRLSFSYYKEEDLIIGLSRLIDVYNIYDKTKVSIYGATGKLGTLIKNEIIKNKDFYYVDDITRDIKINKISDVILDVTNNEATYKLFKYLLDNSIKIPVIVGTTGLTDETKNLIKLYSINNSVGMISNFSEGIVKIKKLIDEMNKLDVDWEYSMIEKHHIHKKDSPSGTAQTLIGLMNRDCKVESIREGEIIGYHQINVNSNNEEIIISHNAKNRNLFAKGSLKYLKWILNKSNGIYYEMDDDKDFYMKSKILGDTFLVTESKEIKNKIILKKINEEIDYIILIDKSLDDQNFWDVYDKFGDKVSSNGNDLLMVAKYNIKNFNTFKGKLKGKYLYKIEDSKIYLEIKNNPTVIDLKEEYTTNLSNLINQLSGLNVLGVSKYVLEDKFLILEIKENLDDIDSDVIDTFGSIINGDKDANNLYDICFVNIMEDNQIRMRYYDKVKAMESDGNTFGCICVFDYLACVNELSYNENLQATLILNKEIVKTYYNNDNFFISIQK